MGIFGAKLLRPIGIGVSTRKALGNKNTWKQMAAGWSQTQPAAPAPNPQSDIVSVLRLGIALDCVVSAVAASYTANAPGGWVGCIGIVDELVVDGVGEEVRRAWGDRPRAAKCSQGHIADVASRSLCCQRNTSGECSYRLSLTKVWM